MGLGPAGPPFTQLIPDRFVRYRNPLRRLRVAQAMRRQMRLPLDPRDDKIPMRFKNPAPKIAHLARRNAARRRLRCNYFTTVEAAAPNRAATTRRRATASTTHTWKSKELGLTMDNGLFLQEPP